MARQLQILLFLMSIMFFMSCYNSLQVDHAYFNENGKFRRPFLHLRKLGERATASSSTFNVDDYGAKGDGNHDDTQAFLKTWKKACSSGGATIVVPKRNYLLKPITFDGPCQSSINVKMEGILEATDDRSDYKDTQWIVFNGIKNLKVEGGTIDGNGKIWWQNSCKVDESKPCTNAPTAITFSNCNNLIVRGLKVQDAQQMHISFDGCNMVQASGLTVTAPGDSPNTDGIHITHTKNINITDSDIGTGDDCFSIETGSENVGVRDITCGPGHGISIGSLGDDQSEAHVSGVTVKGAKLSETTNGVRIKTYQGGSGSASNIVFKDIDMNNVQNPIIIDQHYCDQEKPCKEQSSAVQVKNVLYENIKGTSASEVAIKFDCSESHPCQGIKLNNVNLMSGEDKAKAHCSNVKMQSDGDVNPKCP